MFQKNTSLTGNNPLKIKYAFQSGCQTTEASIQKQKTGKLSKFKYLGRLKLFLKPNFEFFC